jgi:hypothetical protein
MCRYRQDSTQDWSNKEAKEIEVNWINKVA